MELKEKKKLYLHNTFQTLDQKLNEKL